ncbi:MAG: hypothetical protein EZS28_052261, partial [Streblomastix strix]
TDSTGGHGATLNKCVHQVQQEQGHLLLPPVAVSPPQIIPANIELPPVVEVLPDNTTQPMNNIVIPQYSLTNDTDFQILLTPGQVQLLNRKVQNFEHNKELRDFMIIGYFWRKFWKELDTDLKLDTIRLQSPVSDSEEQGKEKDQSTAFWNNSRKRYRQDDSSNSGGNTQNYQTRSNTRNDFKSQGRGQRGGRGDYRGRGFRGNRGGRNRDSRATDTYYNSNNHLFSVAPWPPVESV